MIEVEAPDGSIVEFPDGTPRDVMSAAMRKRFGTPPAAAAAPASQPPPGPPPSFGESVAMGAGDIAHGTRQLGVNMLPDWFLNPDKAIRERLLQIPGMDRLLGQPRPPAIENVIRAREAEIERNQPANVNRQIVEREQDYQARRRAGAQTLSGLITGQQPEPGFDWGRMAGNVAATVPLALALPAGGSVLGAAGAGATSGALTSALQPVTENPDEDFALKKGKQALTGATIGTVTGPAAYLVGRAASPALAPNVRKLADEGVEMTPGQMIGGGVRRAEDALTSIPVLGDQIRAAQTRSIETFNRAAVNKALFPIGQKIAKDTPVGREMVDEAFTKVGQAYDKLLPSLKLAPDKQFAADVGKVFQNQNLVPTMRDKLVREVEDKVVSRLQGQTNLTGETYKVIEGELGKLARDWTSAASPAERELGAAFNALQQSFRDLLLRSNPQAASRLKAINGSYAMLARIRDAAGRLGATEGQFTPAQMSAAVRAGDRSVGKGAFARGGALMQDISDAAKDVLPSKVPDSGTPHRLLTAMLASGGVGAGGALSPTATLAALGAGAAATGAYTNPAQRLIQFLLAAQRPAAVRGAGNALATSGPALSPLLVPGRE